MCFLPTCSYLNNLLSFSSAMMKTLFFLLIFACTPYFLKSEICRDSYNERSCLSWKTTSDFCTKNVNAMRFCKKTCGGCSPDPSSGPKTRAPVTVVTKGSNKGGCGASPVATSRIINGQNAVPGAWPWIASLQRPSGHFCGGTLLTPKWILTASHCVEKYHPGNWNTLTIKVGAHNHRAKETSVQTLSVKRIIMHPQYNRKKISADLAMIELSTPAKLNTRVNIPCLPNQGVYPTLGKQCVLAGWGSIKYPGGAYNLLQQTKLPVVDSKSCKYNPEVVCVGNGFKNQPNGEQQPNACRGDSGGPLVCQRSDGRWQLEGVASFVHTYCKYYTAYSPVNKYLPWINSFI